MINDITKSLNPDKLPGHIAIIMDGNGRWAKARGLPRSIGHKHGVETLREIITACDDLGIKIISLFAFSTENWKRPKLEIDSLMNLLVIYLKNELKKLHKRNIVIRVMGEIDALPDNVQKALAEAVETTAPNTGMVVNVALNYGGRAEIVRAAKMLCKKVLTGELKVDNIDETTLNDHLFTRSLPYPDLLIRPSGELRISNFMLWQCAYTEFWFSDVLWPDFKKEHLVEAILDYQKRERRFGGLTDKGDGE